MFDSLILSLCVPWPACWPSHADFLTMKYNVCSNVQRDFISDPKCRNVFKDFFDRMIKVRYALASCQCAA